MLEFFPYPTPRPQQKEVLESLHDQLSEYDVVVLRLPTGAGKSAIAYSVAGWLRSHGLSCQIAVPNNVLRDQYLAEYDDMVTVKAVDDYLVSDYGFNSKYLKTVKDVNSSFKLKGSCKCTPRCSNDSYDPCRGFISASKRSDAYQFRNMYGNPYMEDLLAVKNPNNISVSNYYTVMAHKLYKNTDVMIFDEAHNILPTLQDLHVKRLSSKDYGFPKNITNVSDLYGWLDGTQDSPDPKIQKLHEVMNESKDNWSISIEKVGLFDKEIVLKPISVANEPNLLWKEKKQKLIFMSATIGEDDVRNLNIHSDIKFIDLSSPIPIENRPIIIKGLVDMSYDKMEDNLDEAIGHLMYVANHHHDEKGFVHCPYNLAEMLEDKIDDPRFVFTDKINKKEDLKSFMDSDDPLIFVGSGCYEGIDLKYDKARWQVVLKVPYPSLAEPRNKLILKSDPDFYAWATTKDLLQAFGRVSRSEDDYGITYVLDKQGKVWYNRNKHKLPEWANEAIEIK